MTVSIFFFFYWEMEEVLAKEGIMGDLCISKDAIKKDVL